MQSAARINDLHACAEGGPNPSADLKIHQGSPNIIINGLPAARVGDLVACHMSSSPTTIATGAPNVLFNGKPAARMGDSVATGGSICQGSSNVFIGDGQCLISIGDSIQVELGNSCMIYLNCGDNTHSQSAPPSTTPRPPPKTYNLEKDIGLGLMIAGIPLDETGVGEAMQAGGAALREGAEAEEIKAAATEKATVEEETATNMASKEKRGSAETTASTSGPTAGNKSIKQCQTLTRRSLGRDGGKSTQTIKRDENGNATSRTHQVIKEGELVHQHENSIGKYGSIRQFPDEWTGTQTINAPYENNPINFGPDPAPSGRTY